MSRSLRSSDGQDIFNWQGAVGEDGQSPFVRAAQCIFVSTLDAFVHNHGADDAWESG